MSTQPLIGRRVLAIGGDLSDLAKGPLQGAILESGGLDRLTGAGIADADLLIINADAWDAAALAAGIQALALSAAPPPVLMVGAHLPTAVVRNLLRIERSDVLAPERELSGRQPVVRGRSQFRPSLATPSSAISTRAWPGR